MTAFIQGFKKHPLERSFAERLMKWLKNQSADPLYVDGVFDILVGGTKDHVDRFVELKVCLKSNENIPISAKQWKLIHKPSVGFDDRARILIYRHSDRCYGICRVSDLKNKISGKRHPNTTSYVNKGTLKNYVEWLQAKECSKRLVRWIHGGA